MMACWKFGFGLASEYVLKGELILDKYVMWMLPTLTEHNSWEKGLPQVRFAHPASPPLWFMNLLNVDVLCGSF